MVFNLIVLNCTRSKLNCKLTYIYIYNIFIYFIYFTRWYMVKTYHFFGCILCLVKCVWINILFIFIFSLQHVSPRTRGNLDGQVCGFSFFLFHLTKYLGIFSQVTRTDASEGKKFEKSLRRNRNMKGNSCGNCLCPLSSVCFDINFVRPLGTVAWLLLLLFFRLI